MTIPSLSQHDTQPVTVARLLAAGPRAGRQQHLDCYGAFNARAAAPTLLEELEASGLAGRGGAGFAAWRKLRATLEARRRTPAGRPVVIANGAEGEPLSSKDETLLTHAPHLVLDGLLATAEAVRAQGIYVYATEPGLASIRAAAAERADASRIRFVEAPDAFITGQATAVVNAIENGIAIPRDHTDHLTEVGLRRRPTLLHNVETLAHIALIARYGAQWFRSVGTADDPGTRLVSISGDVARPQVLEVAGGAPLPAVLRAAGADLARLSAVLIGGYHGTWLVRDELDAPLSPAGLAPLGGHPGAGIIYALDRTRCGLRATSQIIDHLAAQSARQCGPCRFGLPALAESWHGIIGGYAGPAPATRLATSVDGRGACAHPDGTARLSHSAMRAFADDIHHHSRGRCTRTAH
jgi:NADH:ubiquinone oxidoreductase subunit F (NADH-binding)